MSLRESTTILLTASLLATCKSPSSASSAAGLTWPAGPIDAVVSDPRPTFNLYTERERVYLLFLQEDRFIPQRPRKDWTVDTESVDWNTALPAGLVHRRDPRAAFPSGLSLFGLPTVNLKSFSSKVTTRAKELVGDRTVDILLAPPLTQNHDTIVVSLFYNPLLPNNQNYLQRVLSPLDTGNEFHNQIAFVFSSGLDEDIEIASRAIVHAMGHLYGLSDSNDLHSLMTAPNYGAHWSLGDTERNLLELAIPSSRGAQGLGIHTSAAVLICSDTDPTDCYAVGETIEVVLPIPAPPQSVLPPQPDIAPSPQEGRLPSSKPRQRCPIPIEVDADGKTLVCGKAENENWSCEEGRERAYVMTPSGRERACVEPDVPTPRERLKRIIGKTWKEIQDIILPPHKRKQLEEKCDLERGQFWPNGECTHHRTIGAPRM